MPTQRDVLPKRRRLSWETAVPVALLLWTFLLGCSPMRTTDIWWHLRTGQLMIERGEIPQTDWFTFADWNQPWIDLHWGFQLLVTALYSAGVALYPEGGVDLLVLLKAGCLTATVGIGWLASGRGLPNWAKACCWFLPIVCLSGRALVRPEMLSLIFLSAWLWILVRAEHSPRWIWGLPALQIFWTNCHGLFVLGLVVGAAYGVDRFVRGFAGGRWGLASPSELPAPRPLVWAGLMVLLACLINPYFEEGALFPLTLYRKFSVDQVLYSTIGEFRRPIDFVWNPKTGFQNLNNLYFLAEAGLWLVTAASFFWTARRKRISIMRLLLFAAFSHLAWKATRNTNVFAIVSVFVLCGNCADAWKLRIATGSDEQARTETRQRVTESVPIAGRFWTAGTNLLLAGLIVSVVTGRWSEWNGKEAPFGLGEREAWYAHAAARFADRPGFPHKAFVANEGQAAVYIFHNGPERRVFMDGRLEVARRETYQTYARIRQAMATLDRRWESLAVLKDADGNLPVVILDSRTARPEINGLANTPGWRMVFADRAAAVFLETKLAEKLNLPAADPTPLIFPP